MVKMATMVRCEASLLVIVSELAVIGNEMKLSSKSPVYIHIYEYSTVYTQFFIVLDDNHRATNIEHRLLQ